MNNLDALEPLRCQICGGTMTKVSDTEAVCTNNETHKRKVRKPGTSRVRQRPNTRGQRIRTRPRS